MSTPDDQRGHMKTSKRGRDVIRNYEGVVLHAYVCPAGYMTIGVGHMLTRGELHSGKIHIGDDVVQWQKGMTHAQADALLAQDLESVETQVDAMVSSKLTQGQFDALVSFTFNVGAGAFAGSTLRKLVNLRRFAEVPGQFRRWIHGGGKKLPGLVNRREAEIALWES